jgi:hypothetical protein
MGIKDLDDDTLSPEDSSMQVQGSVEEIVANFQRSAAAQGLQGGGDASNSEIAQKAMETLHKEGMANFNYVEQQELINEGKGTRASNLDRLDLTGTHYSALEEALAKNDDDDDSWMS